MAPASPIEDRKREFLKALKDGHTIRRASSIARISRNKLYDLRDSDPKFRREWEQAMEDGGDRIQQEVVDRALDRNDPKSATLLIFLLKGLRPQFKENFRDRPVQVEHVKTIDFSKTDWDEAAAILASARKEVEKDAPSDAPTE